MKQYWYNKKGNTDLLLFFNGWGCDENVLSRISVPKTDVLIISDYRTIDTSVFQEIKDYKNIHLLAWSFGVFMAAMLFPFLPETKKRIAVNGTFNPIDDEEGIPVRIFNATLETYNEQNRIKFFSRIMGGATEMSHHEKQLPDRDTIGQLEELKALSGYCKLGSSYFRLPNDVFAYWDLAVLSRLDKIFPLLNMQRVWKEKAVLVNGNHFPDFQYIIDHFI